MIRTLLSLPDRALSWLEPLSTPVLTTLARFVFAAVLLMYFWNSGLTKIPDGFANLLSPSFNAFAQIFPKGAEAASYDVTQATGFQKFVVLSGTWAEFILPALVVLGLFTRAAALGMIGFVVVQSLTDIIGHGGDTGAWFDNLSDAAILDQRAFWVFLLLYLVFKGGGPLSLDRFILRNENALYQDDLQLSRG
ncbi:MAG: DoxX family protein [Paracoccaceae bacterium]|nr:DoxX family protein [Paracoccaceae bacterium]